jgi:hypothetical protein
MFRYKLTRGKIPTGSTCSPATAELVSAKNREKKKFYSYNELLILISQSHLRNTGTGTKQDRMRHPKLQDLRTGNPG